MAKKNGGKFLSDSAYNQTGKEDTAEKQDPYFSYDDVLAHHLSSEGGDLEGSVNSRSGEGIMGHEAPGEPAYPGKK